MAKEQDRKRRIVAVVREEDSDVFSCFLFWFVMGCLPCDDGVALSIVEDRGVEVGGGLQGAASISAGEAQTSVPQTLGAAPRESTGWHYGRP